MILNRKARVIHIGFELAHAQTALRVFGLALPIHGPDSIWGKDSARVFSNELCNSPIFSGLYGVSGRLSFS